MSDDSNKYKDSEGVNPPPPTSCPPKQEVWSPDQLQYPSVELVASGSAVPVQGYYVAGPYVAPPLVSDPMKYGPQHLQQPPPPPPERTSKRDDEFCTGW
ncbi:hypothetical protein NC653_029800 [Populus alba x Populus x berolinensis]|uniref:Uncharacterized protein n=1 Tax=Populus alba x Populus x berolinensis TaxID=444605 RepID=A0AAD6M2Y0_9ROSI|nr:hypothetical protein NC653_029800 [Populus alba x Populus x berolinensis]